MRILFLSHYYPPEGNAPASRVHALCKRWAASGHDVTAITCAPNVPNGVVYAGYRNRWKEEQRIDGVRVVRTWTYLAPNKGTGRRIANYLSYLVTAVWRGLRLPRPEVLIATSPQFFCGWAGVILARLRRVPFVLEIRDLWPESIAAVEAMGNRRLLRVLEWLEARMYRAAHILVTVGEGYRGRLIAKGVPESKIHVIMNGLDAELFSPRSPSPDLRGRWNLDRRFVCTYCGTIGMACGLDVVLAAAREMKQRGRDDIAFLLVGDGAVRAELEAEARSAGLDRVVFTGLQDKTLMPDFLAASDACLVHLRKSDLFETVMPSKIFEAMGMARPILCGVPGCAAEFVLQADAGLCFEPGHARELADAVVRLADDPVLARRLGEAGHRHVTTHFNRDRLAADYLQLLDVLARGTRP